MIIRDAQKHMAYIDKMIIPMLLPLQKTEYGIMGIIAGHHYTQITPDLTSSEYICNRLGELTDKPVPYLGEMSAFLDLRFIHPSKDHGKSIRQTVHVQHGKGGGQTKSSAITELERAMQGFEADVYIRAHDCQIVAYKVDKLYPKEVHRLGKPDILSKTITVLNLGSATRGYEPNKGSVGYIERRMLRPTTLGWGTIAFSVKKARVHEDPNQSYKIETKVII